MSSTLWRMCEGEVLEGKYHLRKLLGAGSFGGVFLADEVVADRLIRQVALKLIEPDPERAGMQLQELIAAANLDHPGLLRCFAPGQCEINGLPFLYLITELGERTLDERLSLGPLKPDEARDVAVQVSAALAYLHEQSSPLVHRDVKPANVMWAGERWKLGDFGLVTLVQPRPASGSGAEVGTAAYAPPESYEGSISPAWDVWSLGVLLTEALTGCLPFNGETAHQLMIAVSSQDPALPLDLPEPFHRIILHCLVKSPAQRWTARQVLEALVDAAGPVVSSSISTGLSGAFYERFRVEETSETPPEEARIVSPRGEGHYRSLGEALKSVPPGARILVRPGLYEEALVIDRSVEIIGEGAREDIVIETTGTACLVMETEQASVRGLTLRSRAGLENKRHAAVDIGRGQLLLEECDITCSSLVCVSIRGVNAEPILRRCRIHNGKMGGILVAEGAGGALEDCEIFANGGPGVSITGGGHPRLYQCKIYSGEDAGVSILEGGQGELEECVLYDNVGPGVQVREGGDPTIRRCTIQEGRQVGIAFRDGARGTVEDCNIFRNVLSGVTIMRGANPRLVRCKIQEGQSNGLWVSDSGQGTIEDCQIVANAFAGLKITQSGNPVVRRTTIHSGKRTGVSVQTRGQGTLVDCDIWGNAQAGVRIESEGRPLLRRCLLHDGKETGIEFAGGGTLEECDIFGNAKAGVEITQGAVPVIRNCKIHHGLFPGILARGAGKGIVEDCDLYANALPNIAVGENSRLDVRHCRIYDGKQVGIVFWEGGTGMVENCDIYGNALGGVRIRQAADPLLRECRINKNAYFGVHVSEGGLGAIIKCDLRDNSGGACCIEPGCAPQVVENLG